MSVATTTANNKELAHSREADLGGAAGTGRLERKKRIEQESEGEQLVLALDGRCVPFFADWYYSME
jgi:hypothetical protein